MTNIQLFQGDCLETLIALPDCSVDSVVTDPPYELGFMGKGWDSTGIANNVALWREVLRVLKPGGHVAAFGGSRTYHRTACAIEDAGFEIRDSLMWVYGSGFPKSQNVSFEFEKTLCERADDKWKYRGDGAEMDRNAWRNPEAAEWEGWGTALKPAFEPIVLARKPLSEKTVAANVLRWRTGALNIDACRVESEAGRPTGLKKDGTRSQHHAEGWSRPWMENEQRVEGDRTTDQGRWPANVCHDGSDEVINAFPITKVGGSVSKGGKSPNPMSWGKDRSDTFTAYGGDSGSAARFFYNAKANKADRAGSKHPTVKPVNLIEWLCELLTPPGGTILDMFAGSGTTGAAARNKGFNIIMCEREAEYIADIQRRLGLVTACPVPMPA